jgi:hypothetical protein
MEQMLHYILNCLLRVLLEHALELIDEFLIDDAVVYLLNFSYLRDSSIPNDSAVATTTSKHCWGICGVSHSSRLLWNYTRNHCGSRQNPTEWIIHWLCILAIESIHEHLRYVLIVRGGLTQLHYLIDITTFYGQVFRWF